MNESGISIQQQLVVNGIEELLDCRPIFLNDVLRAHMPASIERLENRTCFLGESSADPIGNVRIVLGVKDHDL